MKIEYSELRDLMASYPWLLDDRLLISGLEGEEGPGRGICIGRDGFSKKIELLFQDTRDGRPVIVKVMPGRAQSLDISGMLDYKALLASLDDEQRRLWRREFGRNYYLPQLVLICDEVGEEVQMSAALAGIKVRKTGGIKDLEMKFSSIAEIEDNLRAWDHFIGSGNRTILERENWVEEIFSQIKEFVEEFGDEELETCSVLSTTSLKNSYVRGRIYPFINVPVKYQGKEIIGLYEYCSDLPFSAEHIYCDILVHAIYYSGNRESRNLDIMEKIALELLKKKGYDIVQFAGGMAAFKVPRGILESPGQFRQFLRQTIDDAISLQEEMSA